VLNQGSRFEEVTPQSPHRSERNTAWDAAGPAIFRITITEADVSCFTRFKKRKKEIRWN